MQASSLRTLSLTVALAATALATGCGPTSASDCGPATCAGCCDEGGRCQTGMTNAACGTSGQACLSCMLTQQCVSGTCAATGGGGGGKTDAGADAGPHEEDAGIDGGTNGADGGASTDGGTNTTDGGTSAADAGTDGGTCENGLLACGSACVNPLTDEAHCGQCNRACSSTQVCSNGTCEAQATDCRQLNQSCANDQYCDLNTGECKSGCAIDTQCPQPGTCDVSTHQCACAAGTHLCGSTCVSNSNVATCGTSACSPCATPANGSATCNGVSCGINCNSGYKDCAGACAVCPTSNATAFSCSGSTCVATACQSGYRACNGQCTTCPANATTTTCSGSQCVAQGCATGYKVCSGTCAACPANGSAYACSSSGQCTVTACEPGFHLCGNTCKPDADVNACGASCQVCPAPSDSALVAACVAGQCTATCAPGTVLCRGACRTGGCSWTGGVLLSGALARGPIAIYMDPSDVAHLAIPERTGSSSQYRYKLYYANATLTTRSTPEVVHTNCFDPPVFAAGWNGTSATVGCVASPDNYTKQLLSFDKPGVEWLFSIVQASYGPIESAEFGANQAAFIGLDGYRYVGHSQRPGPTSAWTGGTVDYWSNSAVLPREAFLVKVPGGLSGVAYWEAPSMLEVSWYSSSLGRWTSQQYPVPSTVPGIARTNSTGQLFIAWLSAGTLSFASQANNWAVETVTTSATGAFDLAIGPTGIPHLAWTSATGTRLSTRFAGVWLTESINTRSDTAVKAAVRSDGKVMVLRIEDGVSVSIFR